MINGTMMQYFEWNLPEDGRHWNRTGERAKELAEAGITALWLPPAYKGAGGRKDVGYGVYDTYDLGEFEQKGSVATKYGTKEEYLKAIRALQQAGINVLADVVLNHRMGADGCEMVGATENAAEDRRRHISDAEEIEAYTRFTFPGRKGRYSSFTWNAAHFDGVDWDARAKEKGVYRFDGKSWDGEVDGEHGNYDYLMGADLDMGNPQVIKELDDWGAWYLKTTGVDGFRLDAVKHIRFDFFQGWLRKLREQTDMELFAVGEYWSPNVSALLHYLDKCGACMSLFDVPLHFHFYEASSSGGRYDMRELLTDTLVSRWPTKAVTFVDNHDTQPGQALESFVEPWFKPQAYTVLLLREGGYPCVFYGDYYGIPHDGVKPMKDVLSRLLAVRKQRAYGIQHDYFDHPDIVGFTREGDSAKPGSGLAALLTNGAGGIKPMYAGQAHAGKSFRDVLGGQPDVTIGEDGVGWFGVGDGAAAVYCPV